MPPDAMFQISHCAPSPCSWPWLPMPTLPPAATIFAACSANSENDHCDGAHQPGRRSAFLSTTSFGVNRLSFGSLTTSVVSYQKFSAHGPPYCTINVGVHVVPELAYSWSTSLYRGAIGRRSEEHTSELQSPDVIS